MSTDVALRPELPHPTAPGRVRNWLWQAAALATAIILMGVAWQFATWLSEGWIPSLGEINAAVVAKLGAGTTYEAIWITSKRIAIAFCFSTLIGVAIGIGMGLNRYVEGFFRPLVVMGLAIPDPVYIIVVILVLGPEESSGLFALTLALVPFVVTIVHGSVKSRERQLDDMSRVYRLSRWSYLTQVLARQVTPALVLAARTSFAFAWKIVVLVEAMSQPKGIGSEIYYEFRLLRPAEMIALSLIFIVLMRLVDVIVFGTLERRLLAWAR